MAAKIGTVQQLSQTALTATTTTVLYTVPALTTTILKELVLCNTDTADHTVTIQVGAGTAVANRILSAVNIPAGQTLAFTFSTALMTTQTITGGASVGAFVSCTISGIEVQ